MHQAAVAAGLERVMVVAILALEGVGHGLVAEGADDVDRALAAHDARALVAREGGRVVGDVIAVAVRIRTVRIRPVRIRPGRIICTRAARPAAQTT